MVLVQQSLLYHCSIDHCKQPKKPKKFTIYIKYIKSPWDKTFGVVRELGIKIIEGLFVAISSLFLIKTKYIFMPCRLYLIQSKIPKFVEACTLIAILCNCHLSSKQHSDIPEWMNITFPT